MSNRRRTSVDREARRKAKCPQCGSRERMTKEYDDAFLHICKVCQFPIREEKR